MGGGHLLHLRRKMANTYDIYGLIVKLTGIKRLQGRAQVGSGVGFKES